MNILFEFAAVTYESIDTAVYCHLVTRTLCSTAKLNETSRTCTRKSMPTRAQIHGDSVRQTTRVKIAYTWDRLRRTARTITWVLLRGHTTSGHAKERTNTYKASLFRSQSIDKVCDHGVVHLRSVKECPHELFACELQVCYNLKRYRTPCESRRALRRNSFHSRCTFGWSTIKRCRLYHLTGHPQCPCNFRT